MYSAQGATLRGDVQQAVIQAGGIEDNLIGAKVFPATPVDAKTGQYLRMNIAAGALLKREDSSLRAADGSYNEISRAWESATYECVDRGLQERIDDSVSADAGRYFSVEVTTAKLLLRNMLLQHETRVANTLFSASSGFETNDVSATAYTNANIASIDPAKDITDALEALTKKGVTPNTLVLNLSVFNLIRRAPKLQTFLFGNLPSGQQRLVQANDIASAFGLGNVLIGAATYDAAKKGSASTSLSYIWSNTYMWVGNVQGGDFVGGGAGRTLNWTADASQLFTTESFRDENRRSDILRVRQHTAEVIIDSTAGVLTKIN
jgi:hypothetical protein